MGLLCQTTHVNDKWPAGQLLSIRGKEKKTTWRSVKWHRQITDAICSGIWSIPSMPCPGAHTAMRKLTSSNIIYSSNDPSYLASCHRRFPYSVSDDEFVGLPIFASMNWSRPFRIQRLTLPLYPFTGVHIMLLLYLQNSLLLRR